MVKSVLNSENCTRSWQGAPRPEAQPPCGIEPAKSGGIFPQASSPPQRGEDAVLQDGLEYCWLQDFPGSQPISDEGRMGCDMGNLPDSHWWGETPTLLCRHHPHHPGPLHPQLLLPLVPSPFFRANLCPGLIFTCLFSHPSLCSLTWQVLLLAGH